MYLFFFCCFFSIFCFSLFSLGVGQIEPWSSHLQKLISRPKIKHPNSKIKNTKIQKPKIQTPKSPAKRHRANSLQKTHNFITEFRPPTSLQNSIDPKKKNQQSDCHKGQNHPRGTATKRQFFVDAKSGFLLQIDWRMVTDSYKNASTNNIVVSTRDPFLWGIFQPLSFRSQFIDRLLVTA